MATAHEKPAGQVVHSKDPATLYDPAGQGSAAVIDEPGQYFPDGHCLQTLNLLKSSLILRLTCDIIVSTRRASNIGV